MTADELLALAREMLPGCEWVAFDDALGCVVPRANLWHHRSFVTTRWMLFSEVKDGIFNTPRAALEALRTELERRHAELERALGRDQQVRTLEAFARTILAGYTGAAEIGNLDGGHLQDVAVRLGLLVRQDPTEAGGVCQQCLDAPCTCWFLAPWLRYVPQSYAPKEADRG